jgi:transcriptional regulator with XRE-family HTH domain
MSEAKRLRAFRIKLRLSQKELEDLLGMRRWISNWESGRYPPPRYIWLAMAKLENEKKLAEEKRSSLLTTRRQRLVSRAR